ncbi:MAG: 30S ribosomal protein S6 [Patescibacteria group bacterium]|nr:30S ribosomal protein S6 [Patescibacteria group bacterium]
MRLYQIVVIFRSSLTEVKRKKVLDSIKSWLKDLKITKEEVWGEKALSYPIKSEKSGHYLYWELEGESIPTDFERRLLTQEDVIRHLVIRKK